MSESSAQGEPQNRAMVLPKNKNDGSLTMNFSEDNLEVLADFTPPLGKGAPLSAASVKEALERFNIVYGVRWDTINEALADCNQNHRILKDVPIARGDKPQNEVTEYFELNPGLGRSGVVPGKNGQIDYHAYSPFIIVKKDQILAQKRERKPGKDGMDIHGAPIPHGIIRPAGLSGGEHTRTGEDSIAAEIGGQLLESGGVLTIGETLVIKGAVGYTTGNIIFPGDVIIEGMVSDGFKIHSGGSVTIKQTFDVTDANTRGDLNVGGGIIGRGRALVKVGGILRAKFIENCRVACRKTVAVESGIVNSRVFTMESLEMEDKGTIVGAEIYAVHGIRTGSIGKKGSKYTRLHCGVDFAAQQEMKKQNDILRVLAAKLGKIREFIAAPANLHSPADSRARMEELLQRLEGEQQRTAARVTDLMGRINADNKALVEVSGELQEGTLIEICGIALTLSSTLRNVRIRLDSAQGKLVTEQLY